MSLSQDIKNYALSLGYDYVGITSADTFEDYLQDLQQRLAIYQFGIEGSFRLLQAGNPRQQMPEARSIIVVAYDYFKESFPEDLCRLIGRFYLSRAQPSSRFSPVNTARRKLMKEFLAAAGCRVGDQVAIPERQAAVRAGIASYGKNSFAYGKNGVSFLHLGSFVVDTELDYDRPDPEEICPAGCTLCMEACSLNKARMQARLPANARVENLAPGISLSKMLNMDETYYQEQLRPLVYNYFNKRKYLQRNAAIALGNLGDPGAVNDLEKALNGEEEIVRAYSAWALGQISGRTPSSEIHSSASEYNAWIREQHDREAVELILEEALSKEISPWVRQEISAALAYIRKNQFSNEMNLMI